MYVPEVPEDAWRSLGDLADPLLETPAVIWQNGQPHEGDPPHIAEQRQKIASRLGLAVRSAAETGLAASASAVAIQAESVTAPGFVLATAVFGVFTLYNYGRAAFDNEDLVADPAAVTWSVAQPEASRLEPGE